MSARVAVPAGRTWTAGMDHLCVLEARLVLVMVRSDMVDAETQRRLYLMVDEKVRKHNRKRAAHDEKVRRHNEALGPLLKLLSELKDAICVPCNGHGKIRDYIAQDECRIVDCQYCKGSGLRGER